jgi:hypothetical protein
MRLILWHHQAIIKVPFHSPCFSWIHQWREPRKERSSNYPSSVLSGWTPHRLCSCKHKIKWISLCSIIRWQLRKSNLQVSRMKQIEERVSRTTTRASRPIWVTWVWGPGMLRQRSPSAWWIQNSTIWSAAPRLKSQGSSRKTRDLVSSTTIKFKAQRDNIHKCPTIRKRQKCL